ncbi:MAG TPA: hypothetical protein VD994_05845 [Prosthecobacter sp.]|nr:hypothetical protein [Prosthecobacter sp.]
MLGILLLDSLPITGATVVLLPAGVTLPAAILFSVYWLNRWDWPAEAHVAGRYLKAFALLAWLLTLPLVGFGLFFWLSMSGSQGGWNPTPAEAFAVPLTWLGAVPMPWAGWRLWFLSRRISDSRVPSRGGAGCLIAVVILLFALLGLALPASIMLYQRTRVSAEEWSAERRADVEAARQALEQRLAPPPISPPPRP